MNLSKIQSLHFTGIGGIGMSGLAKIFLEMGYRISGSDLEENKLIHNLKDKGAIIYKGHSGKYVKDVDAVVVSSVIPPDNPEVQEARKRNIPLLSRGKLLSLFANKRNAIVVSGTYGKTTTASLISSILLYAGKDPTIIIGGELKEIQSNARLGKGKYTVIESDESDGSFLFLLPKISVLTSLGNDHLNYYGSQEKLSQAFVQFVSSLKEGGNLITNNDDARLREVVRKAFLSSGVRVMTYGINSLADVTATKIEFKKFTSSYVLIHKGKTLGKIKLPLSGLYNIYDSLASAAVGITLGISKDIISSALFSFQGIKRRYEKVGHTASDILVIDDFAYHPVQIKAVLETSRSLNRRIIAVFQPHRYTRTKLLLSQLIHSLKEVDELILTQIYSAGEKPIPGIDGKLLFDNLKKERNKPTFYLPIKEEIPNFLKKRARKGDLIITLGAGDIRKIGEDYLAKN